MNVCMISTYPPKRCGIADYTEDLVNSLLKLKINVQVLTYRGKYKESFVNGALSGHVFIGHKCAREIDEISPDVIHFQSATLLHRRMLHTFPLFTDKPIVTTVHDLPSSSRGFHSAPFLRLLYKRTRAFVVHSEKSENVLMKRYGIPEDIIHRIPHGIDVENYKPKKRKENRFRMEDNKFRILFFGFIRPDKDLGLLIRSFKYVLDKELDAELVIAGDTQGSGRYLFGFLSETDYKNRMIELVERLGLAGNVRFIGYVDGKDVPDILNNCSIAVFPYRTFQSGPLHKSLACGCAILCVGSDVIENGYNGVVTDPTPERMAEDILKLKNDRSLMNRIRKNARKTAEKMSWSAVAKRTMSVYKDVISSS